MGCIAVEVACLALSAADTRVGPSPVPTHTVARHTHIAARVVACQQAARGRGIDHPWVADLALGAMSEPHSFALAAFRPY